MISLTNNIKLNKINLVSCKKINSINFDNCKIKNLISFSDSLNFPSIIFNNCTVNDLSHLKYFENLSYVEFVNMKLPKLNFLKLCPQLRCLNLKKSNITEDPVISDFLTNFKDGSNFQHLRDVLGLPMLEYFMNLDGNTYEFHD